MRNLMQRSLIAAAIALSLSSAAFSQTSAAKAVVVPDRFLRGYDPVTVQYDAALGPVSGGLVPGPSPFLSIDPAVDGEYRWTDARTVRFLPSIPWPPLTVFKIRTRAGDYSLSSMIAPPTSVSPSASAVNLEPFASIILTFPGALGAAELKKMLKIELRELPGISSEGAEWLSDGDFTVSELEAGKTPTKVSYRISLKKTVPYGKRVLLHVLLSPDPSLPDAMAVYYWDTKAQFRLTGLGGGSTRLPVAAAGSAYSTDQAINCGTGSSAVYLEFSDRVAPTSLEAIKRVVSFTPAVRNLKFQISGQRIQLRFDADRERLYRLDVSPLGLVSEAGRPIESGAKASFYFYCKQAESFIAWKAAEGLMERFGPRQFPMEGRGVGRLDLRIHKIDPLDWDFQPFPRSPVSIDENKRPPMPGEEPESGTDIPGHIRLLGSPPVSKVIDLPTTSASPRTSWGLELGKEMDAAFGKNAPGAYLIGYRTLDKSSIRYWARVLVTDLCLTAAEEEKAVQFYVTTLSSGEAVSGAAVRIEGRSEGKTVVIAEGRTDSSGAYRYEHRAASKVRPERIVAVKGDDALVVRTDDPPPSFANNHWASSNPWLSWLAEAPRAQREASRQKGWVTVERPVYRPDEAVHVVGWVRDWRQGRIERYTGKELIAYVAGPDDRSWTFPLEEKGFGLVSFDFKEKGIPTGEYQVSLGTRDGRMYSTAPFKILSYRIPLFEVNLSGPEKVPLDKPFEVLLTANYYSGGRVTGEEVTWEIEQYPYSVRAAAFPGFAFSTDERFSVGPRSEAAETGTRSAVLDKDGSARLVLDPRNERDGKARRYVVTGTVRGADRQAVVQAKHVYALPPFSVGLKTDRLVKGKLTVEGEFLALDHEEKPLPGKDLTVRLIQRQWHSYIAETDFTTGEAKYVSESVDVPVAEKALVSGDAPRKLSFDVKEPGVYIMEISARDYLGRRIIANSDLFVSAEGQVAWDRKPSGLFEMACDKDKYVPGETARVLIKSPYRDGYALVATEDPDGNRYEVVPVRDGRGLFDLPIRAEMAPALPIQAILYRGRVGDASPQGQVDLGKPATVGASLTLKVQPVENQVQVTLDHPSRANPGTRITVDITAKDEKGRPVDGEAVLWLVDKAVLSLGKERALDPLSAFIDQLGSAVRIGDTRNRALGMIPFKEIPGGDGSEEFITDLFNRSTVRKNFKTVPIFKTGIPVRGGKASVDVDLPDNLTDFAVRVVVTSRWDRFGAARSVLPVRLDIVLQNAVPRFIRPNDSFVAGGTVRVAEGSGGPAIWAFKLSGLVGDGLFSDGKVRRIELPNTDALRLFLPMKAPPTIALTGSVDTLPPGAADGALISFAVEREADKSRDAFEIELPVRADVRSRTENALLKVDAKAAVPLPAPSVAAREGSLKRTILVASDPRLLSIARGFSFLKDYPHGCLEQRASQLYPSVAMKTFLSAVGLTGPTAVFERAYADFKRYSVSCQDESSGLFAYWPGSTPSVSLTAYVVDFFTRAAEAGLSVDAQSLERAKNGLSQSLRSDSLLWDVQWAGFERVQAFSALEAAGSWEASYSGYFLDRIDSLDLYSRARLYLTLKKRNALSGAKGTALEKSLFASLVVKKERGKDVLAGVRGFAGSSRVLLTETRTIAAVLEALAAANKRDSRIALLADWLVERAGANGWGATIDTVAAAGALGAWLETAKAEDVEIELSGSGKTTRLRTKGAPLASFVVDGFASGTLKATRGAAKEPVSVLATASYLPASRGSELPAVNAGFLVEREFMVVGETGRLGAAMRAKAGTAAEFALDDVVEEHVSVVNFADRDFVAVEVPLAAGFEPLDPRLAGAPAEATPTNALTREPTYSLSLDDRIVYYYNSLPKGTYHFYFRVRASFDGRYSSPQAKAELMYDGGVHGLSDGSETVIRPKAGK